ncbi:MAG: hypothetical protein O7B81_16415 [Gammaproteobacteria bacterium]|nr:hypothetical protein [Gammaproteobacteria bacterium]
MSAVLLGLLGGLATLGVSEALLRWWRPRPVHTFLRLVLLSTALRTTLVLGLLGAGLASGSVDGRLYVPALLGSYFLALLVETFRHQQVIQSK